VPVRTAQGVSPRRSSPSCCRIWLEHGASQAKALGEPILGTQERSEEFRRTFPLPTDILGAWLTRFHPMS
jgi:hypothetical protein